MSFNSIRFSLAAIMLSNAIVPLSTTMAVTVSDEDQISATVESVDQSTRHVLLRGPEGGLVTITAGPDVRNLSQLKPGDRVVVTYREALAVELAKPDTPASPVSISGRTSRAAPGENPGGSKEQTIRARVKITGINHKHSTVSFVGPAKIERTVDVTDPEMQAFLNTLKIGDELDVTYIEALAVDVERTSS